jgi:hypothetical protein
MRKIITLLAAAGMTLSPIAASAQSADALSVARAGAPMALGASFLQDGDGESNHGGGSTAVILGVLIIVLIGAVAAGGGGGPSSP